MIHPVHSISPVPQHVPTRPPVQVKPKPKKDLGFHAALVKAMKATRT